MNGGFWDLNLTPEERAWAYEKAERETGAAFWDLDAEDRGRYYDEATGYAERDWIWQEPS